MRKFSTQLLKKRRGLVFTVLILALVGVACLSFTASSADRVKPYYSGEAVEYQGDVYVGTVNTGSFELFKLEEEGLVKKANLISTFYDHPRFNDLKFEKKNNRLYVYLIDGRYLYKYDISNPLVPRKEVKLRDNAWDWFQGLTEVNDRLVTIGINGVKVWNDQLQVINSFDVHNKVAENISFSPSGKYIFNVKDGEINIFNTNKREYVGNIELELTHENDIRQIFNDRELSLIYVVDDRSIKAFNFAGDLIREFEHIAPFGYDVVPSHDGRHLYFSDGVGIVKIDKHSFEPVNWKFTDDILEGSWLMGIQAIDTPKGERVVGFNISNIVVMDEDLEFLGHQEATEPDHRPQESLFLGIDKNKATPGSQISLRGGGFEVRERVRIEFAGKTFYAHTNDQGRFNRILEVPSVLPSRTDIRVIGEVSGLDYSLGFEIN